MSYCRFSEGDVYLYPDVNGGFTCAACVLVRRSITYETRSEVIAHVEEHLRAGHDVPPRALDRLREELESWGETEDEPREVRP